MDTPEAKAAYRQRAGLCELTNARMRNLGMDQFLVRGIEKVTCVALTTGLAMNLVAHAAKRSRSAPSKVGSFRSVAISRISSDRQRDLSVILSPAG